MDQILSNILHTLRVIIVSEHESFRFERFYDFLFLVLFCFLFLFDIRHYLHFGWPRMDCSSPHPPTLTIITTHTVLSGFISLDFYLYLLVNSFNLSLEQFSWIFNMCCLLFAIEENFCSLNIFFISFFSSIVVQSFHIHMKIWTMVFFLYVFFPCTKCFSQVASFLFYAGWFLSFKWKIVLQVSGNFGLFAQTWEWGTNTLTEISIFMVDHSYYRK